ncbi:MAG: hypothetical protein OEO79_17940 [Gemmatimonadota bacterium]|nr:hypothetical protein [Gemmatimonadota bacterium]MDH3422641.1 hypothetical protein [Gemmatimonadota bacterium]
MSGALLGTLVASAVAFVLAMLALGLGVLVGRPPLTGSCGRGAGEGCPCDPRTRACDAWGKR